MIGYRMTARSEHAADLSGSAVFEDFSLQIVREIGDIALFSRGIRGKGAGTAFGFRPGHGYARKFIRMLRDIYLIAQPPLL